MNIREIRCEACGTLNRLPNYTVRRIPECGKCHAKLPETRSTTIQRVIYRLRVQIVAVSMVGVLACAALLVVISERGSQTLAGTPQTAAPPSPAACVQHLLPLQDLNEEYEAAQNPVVFTIRTTPGPFYLVKLEGVAADSPALLFFIQGGQSLDTRVPPGEFRLKYATARHWCADADPFGDDTVFNEANDTLTFSASNSSIQLPLQRDGKEISRNEFYGR